MNCIKKIDNIRKKEKEIFEGELDFKKWIYILSVLNKNGTTDRTRRIEAWIASCDVVRHVFYRSAEAKISKAFFSFLKEVFLEMVSKRRDNCEGVFTGSCVLYNKIKRNGQRRLYCIRSIDEGGTGSVRTKHWSEWLFLVGHGVKKKKMSKGRYTHNSNCNCVCFWQDWQVERSESKYNGWEEKMYRSLSLLGVFFIYWVKITDVDNLLL